MQQRKFCSAKFSSKIVGLSSILSFTRSFTLDSSNKPWTSSGPPLRVQQHCILSNLTDEISLGRLPRPTGGDKVPIIKIFKKRYIPRQFTIVATCLVRAIHASRYTRAVLFSCFSDTRGWGLLSRPPFLACPPFPRLFSRGFFLRATCAAKAVRLRSVSPCFMTRRV